MRSSGGLMTAEAAARNAAWTVLSGPAAGHGRRRSRRRRSGSEHVISFDMGGTSCDVAVIESGQPLQAGGQEVSGRVIVLPMVDVHTVGAGGGSIGWADPGGALRVGPRSAGAGPGPACYGHGGTEPTVTDANLLLGYLGAGVRAGRRRVARRRRRGARRREPRPHARHVRRGHGLGDRARRRPGDGPGAASRDRRARNRPARLRAGRFRRRGADARASHRRAARDRGACSARAAPACSRRSGWSSPSRGATSSARVLLRRGRAGRRRAACGRAARWPPRPRSRELPGARLEAALRPALPRAGARADVAAPRRRARRSPARAVRARARGPLRLRRARGRAGAGEHPRRPRSMSRGRSRSGRRPAEPRSGRAAAPVSATAGARPRCSRARCPPGEEVEGPAVCELPEETVVVPPGWRGAVDDAGTLVLERER